MEFTLLYKSVLILTVSQFAVSFLDKSHKNSRHNPGGREEGAGGASQ